MNSKFLHLDTINSTYILDTSNTSGNTKNSFKTSFQLNETIYKVKKIYLKSLELPISFYNVRYGNTSNILTFTLNASTYTITLVEKQYYTIASLIADLNTAILALSLSMTMVVSLKSTSIDINHLMITFSSNLASMSFTPSILSRMLGFRSTNSTLTNVGGFAYFNTLNNYNLNLDTYLNFSIEGATSTSNINGKQSTFKIPLIGKTDSIMYINNKNSLFDQFFIVDSDNFNLTKMNVTITDSNGYNLNNYGGDYSFSLLVEYG